MGSDTACFPLWGGSNCFTVEPLNSRHVAWRTENSRGGVEDGDVADVIDRRAEGDRWDVIIVGVLLIEQEPANETFKVLLLDMVTKGPERC
jgi:hypothetical protein